MYQVTLKRLANCVFLLYYYYFNHWRSKMKKRNKMKRSKSRKYFSKTASKTHKFNMSTNTIMRGGIRL
nr:MAG: hypothetical protein [Microvirus sp.]